MNMPFGRKSPLEALALPGIILAYKVSQFRERRREAASKRVTERELSALHSKIDKLLNKLDDTEPDPPTSQENECVICWRARATMQTSPCNHCVVCRRCFVKTIQTAVAQRLLPLRCVICRTRVNRLNSISGTWSIRESQSNYVLNGKSRFSDNVSEYRLPSSASSTSLKSSRQTHSNAYNRHWSVSNSASLYSMSSTGSSVISHISPRNSVSSKTSSSSSYGISSPCTTPVTANDATSPESEISKHHLTPILSRPQRSITLPSGSQTLRSASSTKNPHHSHCSSCSSNCSGAVPRKPLKTQNALPRSHTVSFSNTTHTYPGRRSSRGRSLKSNLPPIEEFNSPAKVPHPSPVHISNPRFRYASYTKSNTNTGLEASPFSRETIQTNFGSPYFKASGSKVCPVNTKENLPKMAFINNTKNQAKAAIKNTNKNTANTNRSNANAENSINKNIKNGNKDNSKGGDSNTNNNNNNNSNNKKPMPAEIKTSPSFFNLSTLLVNYKMHFQHNNSSSRKNLNFLFKSNHKDKTDMKNMETYELKKREDKVKQKTEREIRKEEKRRAKEEERIAKATAKEDKKMNKNK